MVGVVAHQLAQFVGIEQRVVFVTVLAVGIVVAQLQGDRGPPFLAGDGLDGEFAIARRYPADTLVLGIAGAAAFHRDPLGHDERRIEAHAELADQAGITGAIAGELAEEFARAGTGDGAQVADGLVAVHAHAVVADADRPGLAVGFDPDAQIAVAGIEGIVVQRLEAQLVAGIGCVGNQLAQEDVAVAVERVDHQIEQLLDLGLESQGFLVCFAHGRDWCEIVIFRILKPVHVQGCWPPGKRYFPGDRPPLP